MTMDYQAQIILPRETSLYQTLDQLASEAKVVCFSGLPAVGKSLYVQQFSYLALMKGRQITTLQWDRARQAFEIEEVLSKYPEVDGITHAGIRKACGSWARGAVFNWYKQNTENTDLLVIEGPLIGNRLVELATPNQDEAEKCFLNKAVQFVVPVPTEEVRFAIEERRKKTSDAPGHKQEKADASPQVVMVLYKELSEVALKLGYSGPVDWYEYKPALYEFVYRKVLKNRNFVILNIDMLIDAKDSVYMFPESAREHLIPQHGEALCHIELMEKQFQTTGELETSVDEWFLN